VRGIAKNGIQAVTGTIDVSLLPPGAYRARLVVTVAGTPAKKLFAPLLLDGVPRRPRTPAAVTRTGAQPDAVAPLPYAVPFNGADVLAPGVIGPFLDEMAGRSPGVSPGAMAAAKAGQFNEALGQLQGTAVEPIAAFVRGAALFQKASVATTAADRRVALEAAANAFRDSVSGSAAPMVGAFYIGACYAMGGRDQQAANAWQTSLAGLDRYPVVYRVLADTFARLGDADHAVAILTEASRQWPDDDVLNRLLVQAQIASGLQKQALTQIESMLGKQPSDAALVFLALQTIYSMATQAPVDERAPLVERLQQYRELYAAANGPRLALVDEWIAYFKRRT
jgi:tetratricopeptide (TPR) repeat protein